MTSFTMTRPIVWKHIEEIWKALKPSRNCATSTDDAQKDSRAERDFILEMLDRNPEAFQSEFDIHSLARLYRCKF
ncbi:hypothetical protein SuNHUV7_38750 (plasmid) [Pseudoseohaeicola sp. NH-UV-7]|uniref:hypothetical protein n=1 Tax=Sulfitobacter sp. TBRI5 TaxID=2989732 RepID=UPI003A6B6F7B